MRHFIVRLASSKWLKVIALSVALLSGLDDLLESWVGITDLFHLDVAHGVAISALSGLLDVVAKVSEQGKSEIEKLRDEKRETHPSES